MAKVRNILIVVGEASGDRHAAKLVAALNEEGPCYRFFGAAGPRLRAVGVQAVVPADDLSVVGLTEIAGALPKFLSVMRTLKRAVVGRGTDLAILVDFPDFNLKLAKWLKRRGIKVAYYISPQLWAWRSYRIEIIRKHVDLVLSILPFETEWYAKRGVLHVEYVGSPLAREVHAERTKAEFSRECGLDPSKPIISLLPGSRAKEIERILPVMLRSAEQIKEERPDVQFCVCLASPADLDRAKSLAGKNSPGVQFVIGETYDALNASDAAAITSGTATLEAGFLSTPMVVVYRTSGLNYRLLEPIIDVPHYGLINLVAGKRVAKELIQDDLTPEMLAAELIALLEPSRNQQMRSSLREAVEKLGHGGASKRAAAAIGKLVEQSVTIKA